MKLLPILSIVIAATLLPGPVFAQSNNDAGGTGAVSGEGPGGSGAGQTSGGPGHLKMKPRKKHHTKKM